MCEPRRDGRRDGVCEQDATDAPLTARGESTSGVPSRERDRLRSRRSRERERVRERLRLRLRSRWWWRLMAAADTPAAGTGGCGRHSRGWQRGLRPAKPVCSKQQVPSQVWEVRGLSTNWALCVYGARRVPWCGNPTC